MTGRGITVHTPLLSSTPRRMRSFIKAVHGNIRRYSTLGSRLNAEMTEMDILELTAKCYIVLWSPVLKSLSEAASIFDACVEGESRMAAWSLC